MMGQQPRMESLFYYFRLGDQIPEDHLRVTISISSAAVAHDRILDEYLTGGGRLDLYSSAETVDRAILDVKRCAGVELDAREAPATRTVEGQSPENDYVGCPSAHGDCIAAVHQNSPNDTHGHDGDRLIDRHGSKSPSISWCGCVSSRIQDVDLAFGIGLR